MSDNDSSQFGTASAIDGKGMPTFKVVMVGDCSVGKTCLLKRYIEDTFVQGENATLGSQLYSKKLQARWAPKEKFDDSKSQKSSQSRQSKDSRNTS